MRILKYGIRLIWGNIRALFIKINMGKNFKYKHLFSLSPLSEIEFNRNSKISFGHNLKISSGTILKVRKHANLEIGDNVYIGNNNILVAHKSIVIGDDTTIGPNVVFYDHDHEYKNGFKKKNFSCEDICIGKNVWIGSNCIILKGTIIKDNSIIAAGTIIKGVFEEHTLVYDHKKKIIKKIGG